MTFGMPVDGILTADLLRPTKLSVEIVGTTTFALAFKGATGVVNVLAANLVGEGEGTGVWAGDGLGVGCGELEGDGLGVDKGDALGDGVGLGVGVGDGEELGEGDGVGVGEGEGDALGEGDAVGNGAGP